MKEKNKKISESNNRKLSTAEFSKKKATNNGGIDIFEEDPDYVDDDGRTNVIVLFDKKYIGQESKPKESKRKKSNLWKCSFYL